MKLDFGKNAISAKKRFSDPDNFLSKETVIPEFLGESPAFLFMKTGLKGESSICYWNKKTNKCANARFSYLRKSKERTFSPMSLSTDSKCLLAVEESETDDNPIIVIARLKEK